ncbi:uncharacterized protein LOC141606301 [Silene latifolia]|uniref:uncharacterized protein LOC141606301 n=1 Tax=Silene latifolia TaxID=37657 RepID=UPI003D77C58C
MVSAVHGDGVETLNEDGCEPKHTMSPQISPSRKGLLSDDKSPNDFPQNVTTSLSSRLKMLKISPKGHLALPPLGFQPMAKDNKKTLLDYPPTVGSLRKPFKNRLFKDIDWVSVTRMCKQWVRKPLNMALLLWVACVVMSGAILFLVMTGMLNSALPNKAQRDLWFEVNNQIISALFTLMCLYLHPKRFHHLVLLYKWNSKDSSQLRKVYCKNASYKPNERLHMMIVVVLLHINCFAQYGLCGLNLGFRRANRPALGVGICLSIAIASPAIAGLYSTLSPLGKDYECDDDKETSNQLSRQSLEKKFTFATRDEGVIIENKPEWKGGLFSLWEDFRVAYLSLLCCFCVFGWNMERLGFGNMYVHIVTFLLFCTAPFWIFNLAAVNIDNTLVREILGISGIALSVFGLLYGGFWRIQMRKRFNLPSNNSCFSRPNVVVCFQWLFCCWCSLAQEVRTGDSYEIVEDGFYFESHTRLTPLPREGGSLAQFRCDLSYLGCVNSRLAEIKPSSVKDETILEPPVPATICMEV